MLCMIILKVVIPFVILFDSFFFVRKDMNFEIRVIYIDYSL